MPDFLADIITSLVAFGCFRNEREVIEVAVLDYLKHARLSLAENFQQEGIRWTLGQRGTNQ